MKNLILLASFQLIAAAANAGQWTCESVGLFYNSPRPDMIAVTGKPAPTRDEAAFNSQVACANANLIQCQVNTCEESK